MGGGDWRELGWRKIVIGLKRKDPEPTDETLLDDLELIVQEMEPQLGGESIQEVSSKTLIMSSTKRKSGKFFFPRPWLILSSEMPP